MSIIQSRKTENTEIRKMGDLGKLIDEWVKYDGLQSQRMSMRQRCRVAPVLGRHHRGFAGDFPRNPHQTGLTLRYFPHSHRKAVAYDQAPASSV